MIDLKVSATLVSADNLLVCTTTNPSGTIEHSLTGRLGKWVDSAMEKIDWDCGADRTATLPAPDWAEYKRIVLVGSDRSTVGTDRIRYAAATGLRACKGSTVVVAKQKNDAEATALCEGAQLGSLVGLTRKSGDSEKPVTALVVVSTKKPDTLLAKTVAESVRLVRELVTEAPNVLYPQEFADRVIQGVHGLPIDVEVLKEKELEKGGFGGILGIGSGSVRPPRMIVARYAPKNTALHIALVGKGITFDSGGLSIKPAASMVGMKYDMTGAATVFAVTRAIAALKLPVRVTAWLCVAENMPSGSAIRPNDVVTIRGGKTVEVTNTDAEGRVLLADGLVAASEEKPDAIIDVATLTGAARVALGDRIAGVMGEEKLVKKIVSAAGETGEEAWAMPLPEYLKPVLASDIADIANAKVGNTAAGMLLGGIFLSEFVGQNDAGERIPWAHLDIAGPANNPGAPYGVVTKGATGTMVRTLIRSIGNMTKQSDK